MGNKSTQYENVSAEERFDDVEARFKWQEAVPSGFEIGSWTDIVALKFGDNEIMTFDWKEGKYKEILKCNDGKSQHSDVWAIKSVEGRFLNLQMHRLELINCERYPVLRWRTTVRSIYYPDASTALCISPEVALVPLTKPILNRWRSVTELTNGEGTWLLFSFKWRSDNELNVNIHDEGGSNSKSEVVGEVCLGQFFTAGEWTLHRVREHPLVGAVASSPNRKNCVVLKYYF
jgi:hypothetical protein